jgi:hypothetical protein
MIPSSLRAENRWIVWRLSAEGKKLPHDPKNPSGKSINCTDESYWVDYETAASVRGVDGPGFVLGDGWAGVDLDDCRNPETGELTLEAQRIITAINSYSEVSPSHAGVKIFLRAWLGKNHKRAGLEVYGFGRYFAVTGQHLEGTPTEPQARSDELAALIQREFGHADRPSRSVNPSQPASDQTTPAGDRNNKLFRRACSMRRNGFDDDAIIAALLKYNAKNCKPPLSRTEIERIARSSVRYEPAGEDARPVLHVGGDLHQRTQEWWRLIEQLNAGDPFLFRFGNSFVRLERNADGLLVTEALDHNRLQYLSAERIRWVREDARGNVSAAEPPTRVITNILATPEPPVPQLRRIVSAPMFAPDGSLHDSPGYNPLSQNFYQPRSGFTVPSVSAAPSVDEIDKARGLICDELLGDFPFSGDAEKAHAVALLLLPFVRDLIDGPTPLHMIEKPVAGTGAGLLANVLLIPALGQPPAVMTEGGDDDEWRKRLTAKLMQGPAVLLIDNVREPLVSASLAAALTSTVWEDRILGMSTIARVHCQIRVIHSVDTRDIALRVHDDRSPIDQHGRPAGTARPIAGRS